MTMCLIRDTFMFLQYYKASGTTDRGSSVADNDQRKHHSPPLKCLQCVLTVATIVTVQPWIEFDKSKRERENSCRSSLTMQAKLWFLWWQERLSICPLIAMPVVIKCCFVAEDKSDPADNCDASPSELHGGGPETERPLEKKEAVIWSCPIGADAASFSRAIMSTFCLGANIHFPFIMCLHQTVVFWCLYHHD